MKDPVERFLLGLVVLCLIAAAISFLTGCSWSLFGSKPTVSLPDTPGDAVPPVKPKASGPDWWTLFFFGVLAACAAAACATTPLTKPFAALAGGAVLGTGVLLCWMQYFWHILFALLGVGVLVALVILAVQVINRLRGERALVALTGIIELDAGTKDIATKKVEADPGAKKAVDKALAAQGLLKKSETPREK